MTNNKANIETPMDRLIQMEAVDLVKVSSSAWDNVLSMQNEKDIVENKIVLPLIHTDIAKKHGLSVPTGILLFGPPGTGKTNFAKGIAGKMGWKFFEISPSALGFSGQKEAFELKMIFENFKLLERIVIFFDEFEELALRPDKATKDERIISNEFLKQLPKIREGKNILLICATNNIRMLNPALLRPGRFDFILPVGPLDKESRKIIFENKAKQLMTDQLDIDHLAEIADCFTPADIQAVIASIAHKAFEKEISSGKEYKSNTDDFLKEINSHSPTISKSDMEEFRKDAKDYCRADYCHLF